MRFILALFSIYPVLANAEIVDCADSESIMKLKSRGVIVYCVTDRRCLQREYAKSAYCKRNLELVESAEEKEIGYLNSQVNQLKNKIEILNRRVP